MANWGIASTAPEIEKIKAEMADYLHGLNSCAEIDYSIYSQLFDFSLPLIQKAYELGKKEAHQVIQLGKGEALVYIVYDASDGEYYLYSNREDAETALRGFLDDLIDVDVMKTLPNLKQNLIGSYIAKIETELIIDEDTGKLIEFDI